MIWNLLVIINVLNKLKIKAPKQHFRKLTHHEFQKKIKNNESSTVHSKFLRLYYPMLKI